MAVVGGCLQDGDDVSTLTMGVIPDVDPETAIERNTGLAEYLGSEIGAETELRTTTDYAGLVQAMTAGQVDLAYFGGVSYVLAHHRADARPIVVGSKGGSTDWHSVFVARESASVASMEDLTAAAGDVDLVFGDPLSTSSTVMPTYYLRQRWDCRPGRDFASLTHVGAHDAVAEAVVGGNGEVGALNARIYDALAEEGSAAEDLSEIWRTPGFADYPWAVGPSLDDETVSAIATAFTALDDEGRSDILDRQNVDRYVEVRHEDFEELNAAAEMMGIVDDE